MLYKRASHPLLGSILTGVLFGTVGYWVGTSLLDSIIKGVPYVLVSLMTMPVVFASFVLWKFVELKANKDVIGGTTRSEQRRIRRITNIRSGWILSYIIYYSISALVIGFLFFATSLHPSLLSFTLSTTGFLYGTSIFSMWVVYTAFQELATFVADIQVRKQNKINRQIFLRSQLNTAH